MFRLRQTGIFIIFLSCWFSQFLKFDGKIYKGPSFNHHVECPDISPKLMGNKIYKQNLGKLLSTLVSQASTVDFYNTTVGKSPEKIYGLFQCGQNRPYWDCHECIHRATRKIAEECSSSAEAIVWHDDCMLRYAKRSFFSITEVDPLLKQSNAKLTNNNQLVAPLMSSKMSHLIKNASYSNSSSHTAYYENKVSPNSTFVGYAQCTGDLNGNQCSSCLNRALVALRECCNYGEGGQVLMPSCMLSAIENNLDYDEGLNDVSPAPAGKSSTVPVIAALTTVVIGTVLLVNVLLCYTVMYTGGKWQKTDHRTYTINSLMVT